MGSCLGTPKVSKEARSVDLNDDGLIQKTEMATFVARNEKLYMMLSVNLQLPVEKCQEIATEVAFQLSKRPNPNGSLRDLSDATKQREPTLEEFDGFLQFLDQPTGQQEFFHRTVFSAFDLNGSGYIEPHEIDNFLDIFYQAGSIFAGDPRLPRKSKLKKEVLRQLDTNRDGKLEFTELRTLISGGARAGLSFDETDDEMDGDETRKKKNSTTPLAAGQVSGKSSSRSRSKRDPSSKDRSIYPSDGGTREQSSSNGERRSRPRTVISGSSNRQTDGTPSSSKLSMKAGSGGGSGSRSISKSKTPASIPAHPTSFSSGDEHSSSEQRKRVKRSGSGH